MNHSFISSPQFFTMPITLSPSSIGLFLDCPRCFWLQVVKGIKRPEMHFPGLPRGMDRILKEHFDKHRELGSTPEELDAGKLGIRLFPDLKKLNEWRDRWKGLRFKDEQTGISLMGAIDDLLVTDSGHYAPLDFKTRGEPRKEDTHEWSQHQMDIYSLLLEKNGMQPAGFAILLFYHPKCVTKSCHVEFTAEPFKIKTSTEKGEEVFRKAVECVLGKEEPERGRECEFCGWGK